MTFYIHADDEVYMSTERVRGLIITCSILIFDRFADDEAYMSREKPYYYMLNYDLLYTCI